MKPFAALRAMRRFQKAQLPFLETLEDLAVLTEIGFHQEQGTPISLKQLFLAEIGAAATVQRRLARLKRLGVVQQLRGRDLQKPPGVAETIDWARALHHLGTAELDLETAARTLGALVKYREDSDRVKHALDQLLRS